MKNTESSWGGGADGGKWERVETPEDGRGKEKEEEHKFKGKRINKDEVSTRKDLAFHSNTSLHGKLLGMFSLVSRRGTGVLPHICACRELKSIVAFFFNCSPSYILRVVL